MIFPSPPGALTRDARFAGTLAAPAAIIAGLALATIGTVWGLQHAGYQPCELCYKERLPFYTGLPLAIVVVALALRRRFSLLPAGYVALALIFLAGGALGAYHAGVEWKFWPGPSSCTGSLDHAADVTDFLHQLQTTQVVRCDAPALHLLGLSLAAWNALLCLAIAGLSSYGFAKSDRDRTRT